MIVFRPLVSSFLALGLFFVCTGAAAASPDPAKAAYAPVFLDRLALLSALEEHRWDELESTFEDAQAAYENGLVRTYEDVVLHALETMAAVTSERLANLKLWREAKPDSPFAAAALGVAMAEAAKRAEGGLLYAPVGASLVSFWSEAMAPAESLLEEAVANRPVFSAASCQLVALAMQTGRSKTGDERFRSGRRANSRGYGVRATHVEHLLPTWGGSLGGINGAANSPQPFFPLNPGMEALQGFLPWGQGKMTLISRGNPDDALVFLERARSKGIDHRFEAATAEAYEVKGRWSDAAQALERALEQWPQHGPYLARLALAKFADGRRQEAKASLAEASLLDPESAELRYALRVAAVLEPGLSCVGIADSAALILKECASGTCASEASKAASASFADLKPFLVCPNTFGAAEVQAAYWMALGSRP